MLDYGYNYSYTRKKKIIIHLIYLKGCEPLTRVDYFLKLCLGFLSPC